MKELDEKTNARIAELDEDIENARAREKQKERRVFIVALVIGYGYTAWRERAREHGDEKHEGH